MRLVLLVLSLFSAVAVGQDGSIPRYPVRDIPQDSEKFQRIHKTVADQDIELRLRQMQPYLQEVRILQTISPKRYRAEVAGAMYAIEIPALRDLADDEVVHIPIVESEGIFRYTSILGATTSIKIAKALPQPQRMTLTEFVTRLKSGERFEIKQPSLLIIHW